MPPCAHTECERFTGTIENRSTLPPLSAILITAESPARPPPTTIIFGAAAIVSLAAFFNLPFHYGVSVYRRLLWIGTELDETSETGTSELEERNGTPDPEQFQQENQRKVGQKAHLPRVSLRPADRRGVRNQNMFEEECADWNDARQGMQSPQQKGGTLTRPQGSHSMRYR